VHSPPLFFFFFLNIKLFFHFPFFGVNDNTTTRQHISRGGTLLFPQKVKKRNKKTQLKEESNLLAKRKELVMGKNEMVKSDWFVCNV
jgi:hypothetical protein